MMQSNPYVSKLPGQDEVVAHIIEIALMASRLNLRVIADQVDRGIPVGGNQGCLRGDLS